MRLHHTSLEKNLQNDTNCIENVLLTSLIVIIYMISHSLSLILTSPLKIHFIPNKCETIQEKPILWFLKAKVICVAFMVRYLFFLVMVG